jgi:hypothetical protein
MKFIGSHFTINGIEISIIHNLPLDGKNNIQDAILVWYGSNIPSSQSFCDFINKKREQGLCNYYAFPDTKSFTEWAKTTEEKIEFDDPEGTDNNDIQGFSIRK